MAVPKRLVVHFYDQNYRHPGGTFEDVGTPVSQDTSVNLYSAELEPLLNINSPGQILSLPERTRQQLAERNISYDRIALFEIKEVGPEPSKTDRIFFYVDGVKRIEEPGAKTNRLRAKCDADDEWITVANNRLCFGIFEEDRCPIDIIQGPGNPKTINHVLKDRAKQHVVRLIGDNFVVLNIAEELAKQPKPGPEAAPA